MWPNTTQPILSTLTPFRHSTWPGLVSVQSRAVTPLVTSKHCTTEPKEANHCHLPLVSLHSASAEAEAPAPAEPSVAPPPSADEKRVNVRQGHC